MREMNISEFSQKKSILVNLGLVQIQLDTSGQPLEIAKTFQFPVHDGIEMKIQGFFCSEPGVKIENGEFPQLPPTWYPPDVLCYNSHQLHSAWLIIRDYKVFNPRQLEDSRQFPCCIDYCMFKMLYRKAVLMPPSSPSYHQVIEISSAVSVIKVPIK